MVLGGKNPKPVEMMAELIPSRFQERHLPKGLSKGLNKKVDAEAPGTQKGLKHYQW